MLKRHYPALIYSKTSKRAPSNRRFWRWLHIPTGFHGPIFICYRINVTMYTETDKKALISESSKNKFYTGDTNVCLPRE